VLAPSELSFTADPDKLLGSVSERDGAADMVDIIRRLDAADLTPTDIALRRPTLDEVFLSVTEPSPSTEENR
ncbi:MAG: daunorubicin/doxorubicin resistance ABC transporter ATP-binding protein DrrA, partial [Corynebacterium glyciniphilum]|nr:daunorubicin/doxorubicin resistance ABC transporter ATP-binding protein DrrA [Corynebacterium glyciniphilum]